MVIKKSIFAYAAIITVLLLISIYSLNFYLDSVREDAVVNRMEGILDEYQEIQALSLMTEVFGGNITCLSLSNTLSYMDKNLWETGIKIDKYREATEQFVRDPFYLEQKIKFNRNEIIYLSMLKKMKEQCSINQTVISYFYKKKEDCRDCDAQAFVLSDLNKEIDSEMAMFSFDSDLGLASISTLSLFYNISSFPCIVVEDDAYCGLKNKNQIVDIICSYRNHSICSG